MRLALFYSQRYSKDTKTFGCDLQNVMKLLDHLKAKGVACDLRDTDKMSEQEISEKYIESIIPSVLKKYRIRQVFGSRRHSGWLFGRQVPALVVYDEKTGYPIDVYPHEQGTSRVQIETFLEFLSKPVSK